MAQKEMNTLAMSVLFFILIGFIIGIGVLVLDKTGSAVPNTITSYNNSFSWSNVTNGGWVSLTWGNLSSVQSVLNDTQGVVDPSAYTIYAVNGSIRMWKNASVNIGNGHNASVIYNAKNYNTPARNALGSSTTEIAAVGSDWFGLIVTIVVLSLIITLVATAFFRNMRGPGGI